MSTVARVVRLKSFSLASTLGFRTQHPPYYQMPVDLVSLIYISFPCQTMVG
jgi:hypothetical protein